MTMRKAKAEDWQEIMKLVEQLDYVNTASSLKSKIERLIEHPDEDLIVYELDGKAVAFISIHYIPQLAVEGDFARISYFAVDPAYRSKGIGNELEQYCVKLAKERKCDRIELHSHSRRTGAHRFYERQNYEESPKYLMKKL